MGNGSLNTNQYNLNDDIWLNIREDDGINYDNFRSAYDPLRKKLYIIVQSNNGFTPMVYSVENDSWYTDATFLPNHDNYYFNVFDIIFDVKNES